MPEQFTRFDLETGDPIVFELYTIEEAAGMLNVGRTTLYTKAKAEVWPRSKYGDRGGYYFSPADINAIHDLVHVDGGAPIPDQSETPAQLGTPVDADEIGPLE